MKVIDRIKNAFANRKSYETLSYRRQMAPEEFAELKCFEGKDRYQLSDELLEYHFDAINKLSPEAFCYLLPGIIVTSIKENSELLMCDSVIKMLDRSPCTEYWDDYFIERWSLLSELECEAIQGWLLWLLDNSVSYDDITIDRAFETLELLKDYSRE